MEFKDYYQALGVAPTASADDIKRAYRKLARKHHPDVSTETGAAERMVALNEAHEVLSDPAKRLAYDSLGSGAQQQQQDFSPPPNWNASAFSDGATTHDERSAFFEQLFGRSAPGHRSRGGVRQGSDRLARIELDLLDAYHGAERSVDLRIAKPDDEGRLVSEEQTVHIKVPKGVFAGLHIRLAGQGNPGNGGAPAGDLLLEVQFKPDPRWWTEGRDVHQRLPLTPWEAMLGGTAKVQTPTGEAEVTLPAGWKAGRRLRLKGRGIPGTQPGATPGNLYLDLELALPDADSENARAAYAAMAQAFPTFEPRRREQQQGV